MALAEIFPTCRCILGLFGLNRDRLSRNQKKCYFFSLTFLKIKIIQAIRNVKWISTHITLTALNNTHIVLWSCCALPHSFQWKCSDRTSDSARILSLHFCLIYYSFIIVPLDPIYSELQPASSNKSFAEKINKPVIVLFGNMKYIFRSVLN